MNTAYATKTANPNAEHLQLADWLISMKHTLQRIEQAKDQLESIRTTASDVTVGNEAKHYNQKNKKLQAIGQELQDRILAFMQNKGSATKYADYADMLQQFALELSLFQKMHFEVAKSYFVFIFQHRSSTIIPSTDHIA